MFYPRQLLSFCVVVLHLAAASLAAPEVSVPRVGHAPGLLGVVPEGSPRGRLCEPRQPLPENCQLCSGGSGPCLVELPPGNIYLAPDSRLRIKAAGKQITLDWGRILVQARQKLDVAMAAGRTVTLDAGRSAELAVEPGKPVSIDAFDALPQRERQQRLGAWTNLARPPQGLGQLVVKDSQAESPVRLSVARYHAHVILQPPVALVQIDQSFYNPYSRQEEGTFIFNLPRGASVSRFAMYVTPGQLIEGELIERQRAAGIYQSIVTQRRDPAILEQIGDNLFKMRVFPVFPKDTKRILLDYTIPLEVASGACDFRLPLLSDLDPVWDFHVDGVVRAAVLPGGAASPSHPATAFHRRDDSVAFEFKAQDYRPQSDFLLHFTESSKPEVALRAYTTEPLPALPENRSNTPVDPWTSRRAMYFQASLPPHLEAAATAPGKALESPAPPADVLVLADTSASMRNCPLLWQSVRMILRNLRPADRFRLACIDDGARPLQNSWQPAGGAAVEAAIGQLDRQFCLGRTDLARGLREALGFDPSAPQRRRLVIYVGDGEDTAPEPGARRLAVTLTEPLRAAQAAMFAVLVRGVTADRPWLDAVPQATGGLVFDLAGAGSGQRDLFAWLLAGLPSPERIVSVDIDGVDPEDLYYPTAWLPDRSLNIVGRMAPREKVRLCLTTARDGKSVTHRWELPAQSRDEDVFIGRLWAQRKLDELRRRQPTPQPQIVGLSQEWSLLSPYTAFLVLESEQEYSTWGIDRRQRHRYWTPADARPEAPLPPEWIARAQRQVSRQERESDQHRFQRVLGLARAAVEAGNPALAGRMLDEIRGLAAASKSAEFAELERKAADGQRREALLRALGSFRPLMDPAHQPAPPWPVANFLPLAAAPVTVSADFLRRHPYARQLLKEVKVASKAPPPEPKTKREPKNKREPKQRPAPKSNLRDDPFADVVQDRDALQTAILKAAPQGRVNPPWFSSAPVTVAVTVQDLAAMLGADKGMNVALDRKALADVGIDPETPVELSGRGRMSLRNYARFVLRQKGLVLQEEPYRLLITTPEWADNQLSTEVYPVADLMATDRLPDRNQLANPYLDRELAAEARIRTKLERPVSLDLRRTPLHEAVDRIARLLDDTVLVDARALGEVGIEADQPVTVAGQDVPAKELLRWMLRDAGLTYVVEHEALVVTTPEQADYRVVPKLHSVRGLLYEYQLPAGQLSPAMSGRGMGGGMWGGAGGMAMGGFGGFGGMGAGPAAGAGAWGDDGGPGLGARRPGSPAGLSTGGDAGASPDQPEPLPAGPPDQFGPQPAGGATSLDSDSLIDMIKSTVRPTSWDDVGGAGSVALFEPTLDIVIDATEDVHEEIAVVLDRLRKLPTYASGRPGWRAVTPQPLLSDVGVDFDSLIDLLKSTVMPTSWDDVGGAGSIAPDEPHVALVLSQTQEGHDAVSRLLCLLRRSRYEALRPNRPWQTAGTTPEGPLVAPWISADALPVPLSSLPEPKPESLAALAVRHVPESGVWKWRHSWPGCGHSQTIEVRRQGSRLEIRLPDCILRAEGDAGAVAWPRLGLVELGNWGEAVRQIADRWLPWLPHRTNEELARLFQVSQTAEGRLRLIPAGVSASAKTWIEVEFDGSQPAKTFVESVFNGSVGLPHQWWSQVDGRPTGELEFALVRFEDHSERPTVTMEDAAGRDAGEWELIGVPAEHIEVPALDAGWPGYVRLDWRFKEPAVDRPLRQAVEAIAKLDWIAAAGKLAELRNGQPRQPLLLLLTALCCQHDPRLGDREQMVAMLKQFAGQGPGPMLQTAIEDGFPSLTPLARYEILLCQPAQGRTAAAEDALAGAAAAAGRLEAALAHARAALSSPQDGRQFERQSTVVELLLRLEKSDEAVEIANHWAATESPPPEQLATMAELLARYGCRQPADRLFVPALAAKSLAAREQFGLLCRRAEINQGPKRWRILMDAAAAAPVGSPGRRQSVEAILAELTEPGQMEIAAELARRAPDPQLKAALLLRQAELTDDADSQAELYWRVYKSGQLPASQFDAAYRAWNAARQPQHVIEAAEQWLRAGNSFALNSTALVDLAGAYRAVGRERDAQRAATGEPEPSPPQRPSPGRSRRSGRGTGGMSGMGGMGMF